MNLFKKILKIILAVILGIFILDVGLWAGSRIMKGYIVWNGERLVRNFKLEMERPLREDVYGGKTPEETFDMYLVALKKGDLELASRYFVVDRQGEELNNLRDDFNAGRLGEYINKIDGLNKKWKFEDQSSWQLSKVYLVTIGGRDISIQFSYNELAKIWKIKFL